MGVQKSVILATFFSQEAPKNGVPHPTRTLLEPPKSRFGAEDASRRHFFYDFESFYEKKMKEELCSNSKKKNDDWKTQYFPHFDGLLIFSEHLEKYKIPKKTTPKSIIFVPKSTHWQPLGTHFSIIGRFWNGFKIHHFLVTAWISQNQHKLINGAPTWPSHAALGRPNYYVSQ